MAILLHDLPTVSSLVATAGQTVFVFPWKLFANADMVIQVDGVAATYDPAPAGVLEFSLDYDPITEGGVVTFGAGQPVGTYIVLARSLPVERVTNFPNAGPVPMSDVNLEFTRVVALIQDRKNEFSRSIAAPLGETLAALPAAGERGFRILGFDPFGDPQMVTRADFGLAINTVFDGGYDGMAGGDVFLGGYDG